MRAWSRKCEWAEDCYLLVQQEAPRLQLGLQNLELSGQGVDGRKDAGG